MKTKSPILLTTPECLSHLDNEIFQYLLKEEWREELGTQMDSSTFYKFCWLGLRTVIILNI